VPDRREQLLEATAHLEAPLAVLDDVALDANAADLVARAAGVPIRVASKSLRVRAVLEDVLARPGFRGVMSFSLAESVWLADQGHDDVLLAYPSTSAQGFADLVAAEHRRAGVDFATDHVGDWPKVVLARLGRTVAVYQPGQLADLGALEGRRQGADVTGFALVWLSLVLGTLGAVRLRRAGNQVWWIPAAVVLAVWGATALSYGNPRFLALAQPSLVALAGCGVATVVARRSPT